MWTILQSKSIDPDKNAVNGNYYFRFSFLYIVFSFYLPVLCYCPNIVASSWRQGGYFLFLVVLCVHQQRTGPGEWTEGVTAKLHNKAENCQARVLVHLQSQCYNSKKDQSWRYNLRYTHHPPTHRQLFNINIKVRGPSPISISNVNSTQPPPPIPNHKKK